MHTNSRSNSTQPSLHRFFQWLRQPSTRKELTQAARGEEFENRLIEGLERQGFPRLYQPIWSPSQEKALKQGILDKERGGEIPHYTRHTSHVITQPYGTQQYPDFVVLSGAMAYGVEAKFNRKVAGKPFWNSGLPRPNGIYIYASAARGDLTFFRGLSVVSIEEGRYIRSVLEQAQQRVEQAKQHPIIRNQPYGFEPEVRRAFGQQKKYNPHAVIDFFDNPKRAHLEDEVLSFLCVPTQ